jgi:hypothetical protein
MKKMDRNLITICPVAGVDANYLPDPHLKTCFHSKGIMSLFSPG